MTLSKTVYKSNFTSFYTISFCTHTTEWQITLRDLAEFQGGICLFFQVSDFNWILMCFPVGV